LITVRRVMFTSIALAMAAISIGVAFQTWRRWER
jgi:hypothetical protein